MQTQTQQKIVLFVDDNADDRYLLQAFTRRAQAGFELVCCSNLAEAKRHLLAAEQQSSVDPLPCFVLVDYTLDKECGRDFIAWVRAHESLRGLPLILFTDGESGNRFERSYSAGVDCCLIKPATVSDLKSLLRCFGRCISAPSFTGAELTHRPEYRPPGWKTQSV